MWNEHVVQNEMLTVFTMRSFIFGNPAVYSKVQKNQQVEWFSTLNFYSIAHQNLDNQFWTISSTFDHV